MSDESILMSGSNTELIEPCPRCGDLFYHPKTLIECEKQRAEEWEEIAEKNLKLLHERDCHIEELEHKLELAKEALESISVKEYHCLCNYTCKEALEKLK